MLRSPDSNIIARAREWLLGAFVEGVSAEAQRERAAAGRIDELDKLAETASFAMARADETYDALQSEVARHDRLSAQSEAHLRAGNEAAARQCLAQQLESAARIRRQRAEYEALQSDAETKARQFLQRKRAFAIGPLPADAPDSSAVNESEIDGAMYELRLKLRENLPPATGELEDEVQAAKQLLRAPRYAGILSGTASTLPGADGCKAHDEESGREYN